MVIHEGVAIAQQRLAARRSFIYSYVLRRHYDLKFSGISDDIFSRIRERIDRTIGENVPDSVKRLTAVYENLSSENPENWSNAVHSCRKILQDLADAVYPVQTTNDKKANNTVKLGKDNYINRIVAFLEKSKKSKRFSDIVGSHLHFIGDRLDSIFKAAQKGSHADIISKEEADRYVVYTYLLVGDVLSLLPESSRH